MASIFVIFTKCIINAKGSWRLYDFKSVLKIHVCTVQLTSYFKNHHAFRNKHRKLHITLQVCAVFFGTEGYK